MDWWLCNYTDWREDLPRLIVNRGVGIPKRSVLERVRTNRKKLLVKEKNMVMPIGDEISGK
jgi:hypothetical protein